MSYDEYLLNLLNESDNTNSQSSNDEIKINLYMTLLALNNSKYDESIYDTEMNIIENYLRKVNNLKVKIQLKRKNKEIDNLLNEIKDIYYSHENLIKKYNKDNINIINILDSKEASELTILIDKLTKEKMNKADNKEIYDKKRNKIINNIFIKDYYIKDNNFYLNCLEEDSLVIPLTEFYDIFEYLLNIRNYQKLFIKEKPNEYHISLINQIINSINNGSIIDNKTLIPIILTHLVTIDIPGYMSIDTSNFNIENIKITELYSLAGHNINSNPNSARWNKILLPNSYLYEQIKKIVTKGTYYIEDNKFILENIIDNISDFKVSISLENMKLFLISNLTSLIMKVI